MQTIQPKIMTAAVVPACYELANRGYDLIRNLDPVIAATRERPSATLNRTVLYWTVFSSYMIFRTILYWTVLYRTVLYMHQSFTHSVFTSSVIVHIFACVCEVQLRLCVNTYLSIDPFHPSNFDCNLTAIT